MRKMEKSASNENWAVLHAFCASMRTARSRRHMTQKDLAAVTGITQGDISKLEQGNSNPSLTRTLEDVDAAVINGNYALQAGLGMQLKVELRKKSK